MSPNSTCDLHLHTHYSDGCASPAQVLHYAASIGLKTVSITDHDNLNALPEATSLAGQLGLELIPGIELTCRWDMTGGQTVEPPDRGDIDLLGYLITLLTQAGYPVDIFDVLDENPRYPGPVHLIAAIRRKGHAESWPAAYSLFQQHWQNVRLCRQTIEQSIAAVHTAGGVAVLAHPISVSCGGGWLQNAHIAALVEIGLDGLEIYHPRHDAEAREHFLGLTQQHNLVVTGGSDEHCWDGSFARMGTEPLSYQIVHAMRERTEAVRNFKK